MFNDDNLHYHTLFSGTSPYSPYMGVPCMLSMVSFGIYTGSVDQFVVHFGYENDQDHSVSRK